MPARLIRRFAWRPFEAFCRRHPLVPLETTLIPLVDGVTLVRTGNVLTRLITRLGGGYEYSVCYLVGGGLLVDTGFPWAMRSLRKALVGTGALAGLRYVVNTHSHEDHAGNNDLFRKETGATVYADSGSLADLRHPEELPWYRNFMFGPISAGRAEPLPDFLAFGDYRFEVLRTPGHAPDHVCLYERSRGWLFSGDLYIAADIDSQLREVDGKAWIASLRAANALNARFLFDGHGTVRRGEAEVAEALGRKLQFLTDLQAKVERLSSEEGTLEEITRRVFDRKEWTDRLSFQDGWLSLLTASDFSRTNVVRSFLKK